MGALRLGLVAGLVLLQGACTLSRSPIGMYDITSWTAGTTEVSEDVGTLFLFRVGEGYGDAKLLRYTFDPKHAVFVPLDNPRTFSDGATWDKENEVLTKFEMDGWSCQFEVDFHDKSDASAELRTFAGSCSPTDPQLVSGPLQMQLELRQQE